MKNQKSFIPSPVTLSGFDKSPYEAGYYKFKKSTFLKKYSG